MRIQSASDQHAAGLPWIEQRRGIHPTAVVDSHAQLADDVSVGAYAIIEAGVSVGSGTVIHPHSIIQGATIIGRNCRIGPSAYVGVDPQHIKFVLDYANPTYLVVGDNVVIRECARLCRSTVPGQEHATRVGDNCYIMGASHIGHDCIIDRHVILADSALLGGHVRLDERCFIGGGSTIHQFVHIGRLAIVAGNEAFTHDVPPFGAVRYGRLKAYNAIGCKRAGMNSNAIHAIRACYHRLKHHRTMDAAVKAIRNEVTDMPEVREIIEFIELSRRGILPSHAESHGTSRNGDEAAGSAHPRLVSDDIMHG